MRTIYYTTCLILFILGFCLSLSCNSDNQNRNNATSANASTPVISDAKQQKEDHAVDTMPVKQKAASETTTPAKPIVEKQETKVSSTSKSKPKEEIPVVRTQPNPQPTPGGIFDGAKKNNDGYTPRQ